MLFLPLGGKAFLFYEGFDKLLANICIYLPSYIF